MLNNLQKKKKNLSVCSAISLALDESTDIKNKLQLAIFVRYVSKDSGMVEKLLDLATLKDTTRSDIKALDGVVLKNSMLIGNIVSITTEGSPSMTSKKQGLTRLLNVDI